MENHRALLGIICICGYLWKSELEYPTSYLKPEYPYKSFLGMGSRRVEKWRRWRVEEWERTGENRDGGEEFCMTWWQDIKLGSCSFLFLFSFFEPQREGKNGGLRSPTRPCTVQYTYDRHINIILYSSRKYCTSLYVEICTGCTYMHICMLQYEQISIFIKMLYLYTFVFVTRQ